MAAGSAPRAKIAVRRLLNEQRDRVDDELAIGDLFGEIISQTCRRRTRIGERVAQRQMQAELFEHIGVAEKRSRFSRWRSSQVLRFSPRALSASVRGRAKCVEATPTAPPRFQRHTSLAVLSPGVRAIKPKTPPKLRTETSSAPSENALCELASSLTARSNPSG